MEALRLTEHKDHLRLDVHVVPRAARSEISGVHGGRLKIALKAPPVDGAANAALVAFLAEALSISKRQVSIVRGERSRQKTVALHNVAADRVRALEPLRQS